MSRHRPTTAEQRRQDRYDRRLRALLTTFWVFMFVQVVFIGLIGEVVYHASRGAL